MLKLYIGLLAIIVYAMSATGCTCNKEQMKPPPPNVSSCGPYGDSLKYDQAIQTVKPCCNALCYGSLGLKGFVNYSGYHASEDGILRYRVDNNSNFHYPLTIQYGSDTGTVRLQAPQDNYDNHWTGTLNVSKGTRIFLAVCYDHSDSIHLSYGLFKNDTLGMHLIQTDSVSFLCNGAH